MVICFTRPSYTSNGVSSLLENVATFRVFGSAIKSFIGDKIPNVNNLVSTSSGFENGDNYWVRDTASNKVLFNN